MMVSSRAYPLITVPKIGPVAMRTPQFPHHCPICNSKRVALIRGEQVATGDQATYACGGAYGLSKEITERSNNNHFVGFCTSVPSSKQ